jgi:hypothetical protein
MLQRLSCILWPSFLAAGVGEMLLFALMDPVEILGDTQGLSRTAAYSVTFFVIWALMAFSSALTWVLQRSSEEVNRCPLPGNERPTGCPKRTEGCTGA